MANPTSNLSNYQPESQPHRQLALKQGGAPTRLNYPDDLLPLPVGTLWDAEVRG